jgi:subtilisin family serine protease
MGNVPVAPDTFSSRVFETYDFTQLRGILSNPAGAALDPSLAGILSDRLNQGLAIDWSLLQSQLRVPHDLNYRPPVQEHGTHVAGIIGSNWPAPPAPQSVVGICPDIRIMDIRVFDQAGTTDEFTLLSALQFLGYLNSLSVTPLVHGANLSFSLVHKVRSFGCGRTPICDACERLVKDGVVVVAAAGNAGFTGDSARPSLNDRYATVSITDPGNAEAAITVGSTHKISPFAYGISYFSSRGPTGDGRSKPDILAPGEKILSALPGGRYGEMDGTSMAAPHVSGAAAILLARYPELIGRPTLVKRILCDSATDLGRERAFQGAGLVDVLRALQATWKEN